MAVAIFGSYAIGRAHEKSDLDLLIIRRTTQNRGARTRAVRRALFGVLHPLDIQVFTPEEFEDSVYEEQSFTWIIVRQARVCHWTREAAEAVPSLLPEASSDVARSVASITCDLCGHAHPAAGWSFRV
jgi:predicted nucleotidyltransferase